MGKIHHHEKSVQLVAQTKTTGTASKQTETIDPYIPMDH